MPKVGLICRMDRSGLGQGQTLRLARLLKPDAIMLIDSSAFNKATQYPTWYKDAALHIHVINGFPINEQVRHFMEYVDVVISCETFYNNNFTSIAKESGVKTILISNPEFFDWFPRGGRIWNAPLPDRIIVPTNWLMDKMAPFKPEILPTPIFADEFLAARTTNFKRSGKPRYLFVNGKSAIHDRNGLESLYAALALSKGDYEIVIKAQHAVKRHPDPRLIYDFTNPEDQAELYTNFDALILPRRYAGQCLPMSEALMSGLPVIMTDIAPNDSYLPEEWLVPASKIGQFMTRTMLDIYAASPSALAIKLDTLDVSLKQKQRAYQIAQQFEAETLRPEYEKIL